MYHTSLIIQEDFYTNPLEVRAFALAQDFSVAGNYPGSRTKSFTDESILNTIQDIVLVQYVIPKYLGNHIRVDYCARNDGRGSDGEYVLNYVKYILYSIYILYIYCFHYKNEKK